MNFIVVFFALSIINVIFSTVRTLLTVKGGKVTASLLSGGYFAFYNIMLIYTVADFPLWQKCLITFTCNVIGVFIVKLLEERMQKDKFWKIEATVNSVNKAVNVCEMLNGAGVSYNFFRSQDDKYYIFNIFCKNKNQKLATQEMLKSAEAKYFVTESKEVLN